MAFLYMFNWMLRNQQMYLQNKKVVLENWLKEIIFNPCLRRCRKCEVVMLWVMLFTLLYWYKIILTILTPVFKMFSFLAVDICNILPFLIFYSLYERDENGPMSIPVQLSWDTSVWILHAFQNNNSNKLSTKSVRARYFINNYTFLSSFSVCFTNTNSSKLTVCLKVAGNTPIPSRRIETGDNTRERYKGF